ncbi:MAG: biotin--[acetyl-CoA-carboxylase] ligase [Acidobacteria bacterium]|nr:biotin--[acetyl-CoA-carboxylase] ligase [Acidobacteriota bacterium]
MNGAFRLLADRLSRHVENIVVLEEADSTHAMAIRAISQMEAEEQALPRTVLIAGRQTAGIGRLGRRWLSPVGGLYLNWLASDVPEAALPLVPILAAAAGVEALDDAGVSNAAIKWPNDLLIDGRKAGGILVHGRRGATTWTTVGLGINLTETPHPDDNPPRPPTSLAEHLEPFAFEELRARLAGIVIERLHAALLDPAPAVELWRQRLIHRPGEKLTIQLDPTTRITGTFLGTDAAGHLRIDTGGAERVISSGDLVSG